MPADYEYWTNTEIKVRVPTAGWLVNNNNIISGPEPAVAVTGRIAVRNPDGYDDTGDNELIIQFAQFNSVFNLGSGNQSFPRKLIDRSGNGGYYLVFDPSFNDVHPQNIPDAKQDVIDAFCEWNAETAAKLEIVENCPTGSICFKVSGEVLPNLPNGTVVLAAGGSNPSGTSCTGETVIVLVSLKFNTSQDWITSSVQNPLPNENIIKNTAYHEVAHMLQLGHVYNEGSLMHPMYENDQIIDVDAIAGGTHVSNVSANTACANPLQQGLIASCMNPATEK